jgi:osmotically-inducible protein OsmY
MPEPAWTGGSRRKKVEAQGTIDQWVEGHDSQKLATRAQEAEDCAGIAIEIVQASIDDAERMTVARVGFSPQEQEFGWSNERQRIQAEALSRRGNSGYHELGLVSCSFQKGVLTLRGQVSSFYLKQVAQELIRRLEGAEEVNNHLEVVATALSSMNRHTTQRYALNE